MTSVTLAVVEDAAEAFENILEGEGKAEKKKYKQLPGRNWVECESTHIGLD